MVLGRLPPPLAASNDIRANMRDAKGNGFIKNRRQKIAFLLAM